MRFLAEVDAASGQTMREYIWLDGAPLAYVTAGEVYHVHVDHLGTPQVLTDSAGSVAWRGDYAPFGAASTSNSLTFNLRFPGQYFDAETGLHYNWHRYYDPETGRYITSDPTGLAGGLNTYGYVQGNPVSYADPTGLVRWKASYAGGGLYGIFGAGYYDFKLVSECVEGKQAWAHVILVGAGLGASIGYTTLPVEVKEGLVFTDSRSTPDPMVFDGQGGIAGGGLSIAPSSWGFTIIRLGEAEYAPSRESGATGGIEIGASVMTGSSTVWSGGINACGCN